MSEEYPDRYDNCKDCVARCPHAGKDRKFVYNGFKSCKIVKKLYRLDRSAWAQCDSCEERKCDNCANDDLEWFEEPCNSCSGNNCGWKPKHNFCQECGRPMTDAAWDMLEKRLENAK